jgi:hypothetical protein
VPVFVASIAVLSIFWRGHWLWSRRYGLEDAMSILISWVMLVTILIFVYPLKLLFGAMFYYLSNGQVGQSIHVVSDEQARTLFAVYAIGTAAIALEILLLNLHAWRLREPLRLNERERLMTRGEIGGWSIPVGVALLALVLALTLPIEQVQWSGWCYFLMSILIPLYRQWMRRRLKKVESRK